MNNPIKSNQTTRTQEWSADDHTIQQAARGIVAHYEGEAWKWRDSKFAKRVDEVAHLLAAAPKLLEVCKGFMKFVPPLVAGGETSPFVVQVRDAITEAETKP